MATSTSGSPNDGRGADLAILTESGELSRADFVEFLKSTLALPACDCLHGAIAGDRRGR